MKDFLQSCLFSALFCATFLMAGPVSVQAAHTIQNETEFKIRPSVLEKEITKRIVKIPEFKFIRQWAQARNLKLWIAGGTAAGLGVTVRQELENKWRKKMGLEPKCT